MVLSSELLVGNVIISDEELQWAIDHSAIVEVYVLGQLDRFGFLQGFNDFAIKINNHYYFRNEVHVIISFLDN